MEWILGVLVGIGLSASCGFRVFVPPLIMSIAVQAGHLEPATGFQWIGSWPVLTAFAVATVLEIAAYFIPVVSNALDTVATPAAVVAGTILTASMLGEVSPFLRWSLAAVAGGATAGGVQLATVMVRNAATPAGGSGLVAAGEDAAAVAGSILAVVVPVAAALILAICAVIFFRRKQKACSRAITM
jgi:hypothetical protein